MKQQHCTGYWWNQPCSDVAISGFDTAEGHSSTGELYAKIRVVLGQPNTRTPEPTTYALMAAGLAALSAVSRRRRKA